MKQNRSIKVVGLSLLVSLALAGCGNGNSGSATSLVSPSTTLDNKIDGSILKGAIDGATITMYDENDKKISSAISSNGKFKLSKEILNSSFYTIKSSGGSYEDEATKEMVTISSGNGLETLLTKEELSDIINKNETIAITPETTIFSSLVKDKLKSKSLTLSISEAKDTVYNLMIKNSSPMPDTQGDMFLKRGDLTKAIPSDSTEAFARNRAVSFSTLTKSLDMSPNRTFEIINKMEADYKDGKADTVDIDGRDINITKEYAMARTRLFEDTTNKIRNGEISQSQMSELQQMGFNTDSIGNQAQEEQDLQTKIDKYMNSSTLPSLHILPIMVDEDGNLNDTKATYSFIAKKDVNVTIETPNGSWVTPMWRYNGNPLPLVVRTTRGYNMTLNLDNQLDADTTIHWHGFKIPADMDGGPDYPVASKATKAYTFKMQQPASPLWFHPHPDMQTGKQVYMGLAGVFLLEDNISKTLEANNQLPSGNRDVTLLVQDRRFDTEKNGVRELLYKNKSIDSDGMLGDIILVNGSVVPKHEVSTIQYRYRLYNVSNARTYDFAFSDGRAFKIVGTDGGLLNEPVEVNHILLGAAQRVELIADFSKDSVGSKVMLVSRPFKGDIMGGMMNNNMNGNSNNMTNNNMNGNSNNMTSNNMNGNSNNMTSNNMNGNINNTANNNTNGTLDNGIGLPIMRFDIVKQENDNITIYSSLPQTAEISKRLNPLTADNVNSNREFLMSMYQGNMGSMSGMNGGGSMVFAINGKIFDPNRVDEYVPANSTEIWNIKNISPMAHPFHAHATQYQIIDRNGIPATGVDLGWKDTFLVQPGESVRIIGKFEDINKGDYMYHCHILEHEDAGMMGYFRVGDTGHIGNK